MINPMINDRIISVLVSADITRKFFSWKYQVAAGDADLNSDFSGKPDKSVLYPGSC